MAFSASQILVGPLYCLSIWLAWPCPSRIAGVSFLAQPLFFHSDPPPWFDGSFICFIAQSGLVRFSSVLLSSRKILRLANFLGLASGRENPCSRLENMKAWLVPLVNGQAPQTFYDILCFYVLPQRQHLIVGVTTIVMTPLGTCSCVLDCRTLLEGLEYV